MRRALLATAAVMACMLATLAMPVRTWRTGEQRVPPLSLLPDGSIPPPPHRVWIDTDAACGAGRRTDPDDCFAILLLAHTPGVEIAGISTVFGNRSLPVTEATARELVNALAERREALLVHTGSAERLEPGAPARRAPAHDALAAALASGPLTVLALGPLTNIAIALHDRPERQRNVAQLVTVMGRRMGHLFHPAEGMGGGSLFGHGPVFRDFNVAKDIEAAARVVAMHLPMALIPYEAARAVEITPSDLDRLTSAGGAAAWVANRARDWVDYWLEDIGRPGFYPFDLLAAAFVIDPNLFRCARVHAWVGEDPTLFLPFFRPTGLLVTQDRTRISEPMAVGAAWYCPGVDEDIEAMLVPSLAGPVDAARDRQ